MKDLNMLFDMFKKDIDEESKKELVKELKETIELAKQELSNLKLTCDALQQISISLSYFYLNTSLPLYKDLPAVVSFHKEEDISPILFWIDDEINILKTVVDTRMTILELPYPLNFVPDLESDFRIKRLSPEPLIWWWRGLLAYLKQYMQPEELTPVLKEEYRVLDKKDYEILEKKEKELEETINKIAKRLKLIDVGGRPKQERERESIRASWKNFYSKASHVLKKRYKKSRYQRLIDLKGFLEDISSEFPYHLDDAKLRELNSFFHKNDPFLKAIFAYLTGVEKNQKVNPANVVKKVNRLLK